MMKRLKQMYLNFVKYIMEDINAISGVLRKEGCLDIKLYPTFCECYVMMLRRNSMVD